MMRDVRNAFAAMVPVLLVGMTASADDCCVKPVPRYACTTPAPPSRFPPVPIQNPFACDGPYCDPGYYGGNPYAGGPIPLPPPPGTGPYGGPYGGPSYGTFPYGSNPYGISPYGTSPGIGPYGPSNNPLVPKEPIFSHSRTLGGITRYIEDPLPLCKVSFWNQTASELTIFVGDKTHRIARDRAVVVPLPRDFAWKTDGLLEKRELVPVDLNYFDVVIR
jgi:hypothetical protein